MGVYLCMHGKTDQLLFIGNEHGAFPHDVNDPEVVRMVFRDAMRGKTFRSRADFASKMLVAAGAAGLTIGEAACFATIQQIKDDVEINRTPETVMFLGLHPGSTRGAGSVYCETFTPQRPVRTDFERGLDAMAKAVTDIVDNDRMEVKTPVANRVMAKTKHGRRAPGFVRGSFYVNAYDLVKVLKQLTGETKGRFNAIEDEESF